MLSFNKHVYAALRMQGAEGCPGCHLQLPAGSEHRLSNRRAVQRYRAYGPGFGRGELHSQHMLWYVCRQLLRSDVEAQAYTRVAGYSLPLLGRKWQPRAD